MIRGLARASAALALVAAVSVGCSSGPTTKEALCEGYDELSKQLFEGNGIFGNPLFRKADQLGSLAVSYESDDAVVTDGEELKRIADSDSTDGGELRDATGAIAAECGKPPLTISALVGG